MGEGLGYRVRVRVRVRVVRARVVGVRVRVRVRVRIRMRIRIRVRVSIRSAHLRIKTCVNPERIFRKHMILRNASDFKSSRQSPQKNKLLPQALGGDSYGVFVAIMRLQPRKEPKLSNMKTKSEKGWWVRVLSFLG